MNLVWIIFFQKLKNVFKTFTTFPHMFIWKRSDALPSPLLDQKGVQLCQIVEVVWDLKPLTTSSTKKGGREGMLKVPGLD